MDTALLVAIVGATSGLLGSAAGGLISFYSSRATRSDESIRDQKKRSYDEQEKLYSEFVGEAVRIKMLSLQADQNKVEANELVKLATLEARTWFHSAAVGAEARELAKHVMKEAERIEASAESESTAERDFPELRDSYVKACTLELSRLRNEA